MSARTAAVAGLLVVVAAVLQPTVVARLPLPGDPPALVLLVVLAVALSEGPAAGAGTGFAAGALADLLADGALGRLALAATVAGYLVGLAAGDRSALLPFLAVAGGTALALVVYTAEGLLLGDPRVGLAPLGRALISTVPWSVVLAPLVVPLVGRSLRAGDAQVRA